MRDMRNILGTSPYEKQSASTEVLRPLLLAAVYGGVLLLAALGLLLQAVLIGRGSGPLLLGLLFIASVRKFTVWLDARPGIDIEPRTWVQSHRAGVRLGYVSGLALSALSLVWWPLTWEIGAGKIWWVCGSVSGSAPHWCLWLAVTWSIVADVTALQAGKMLLSRILMEIGYPTLAGSLRAVPIGHATPFGTATPSPVAPPRATPPPPPPPQW
jgi:hypothetical protein